MRYLVDCRKACNNSDDIHVWFYLILISWYWNRQACFSISILEVLDCWKSQKRIVTFQKLDRLKKIYSRERPETYKDSVGQSCKAFEIGNVLWNRLEAGKAFASLDSHFIGYIYLLLPISKRVNLFKKNSLHLG